MQGSDLKAKFPASKSVNGIYLTACMSIAVVGL
jgi:hypothetical protein